MSIGLEKLPPAINLAIYRAGLVTLLFWEKMVSLLLGTTITEQILDAANIAHYMWEASQNKPQPSYLDVSNQYFTDLKIRRGGQF